MLGARSMLQRKWCNDFFLEGSGKAFQRKLTSSETGRESKSVIEVEPYKGRKRES